jgi:hypothetical protein
VILRLGQAQYFQGKRQLALDTFKRITNDPYLSTLNQKIPSLGQEQAAHLVQGFRLADINHQIGLAYLITPFLIFVGSHFLLFRLFSFPFFLFFYLF